MSFSFKLSNKSNGLDNKKRRWGDDAPRTAVTPAPAPAQPADPHESLSRAERLKLWKANQAAKSLLAPSADAPPPEPATAAPAPSTDAPSIEVDPLESYMSSIADQAVVQAAEPALAPAPDPTEALLRAERQKAWIAKEAAKTVVMPPVLPVPALPSAAGGSVGTDSLIPLAVDAVIPAVTPDDEFDNEDDIFAGLPEEAPKSALELLNEKMVKKDLKPVDHSKVQYAPFRKDFYIEAEDVKALTPEEIAQIRDDLEIHIRGKRCPAPMSQWVNCGLSDKLLGVLKKLGFNLPFAIQRQAIPAIMSGRDVIGVAKTGSGKTLAYLLPLFRHIMDQPPLRDGEGPIGLIMAPARELAIQIYKDAKPFTKATGRSVVAVYGGAGVAEQIADLKRGADIVVCTPGRMIDILTMNAGRLISLQRVTYVVLDEADRMFDMGFEPQISRIIGNTRPDRQTVLFSATFPAHVEGLARRVLTRPLEIVVGGKAKAAAEIEQIVEVRGEDEKFRRLLQLLGTWYEKGQVLVFVDTQQRCDALFMELVRAGYTGLTLHAGKDQYDRDQTILDFKNGLRNLMIATSVAGRGLDVKNLTLVINYNCPNHLEDYIHRVGRTGRAGRKGTAITFITPEEGQYAPDLLKALTDSKQVIPPALEAMAGEHERRVTTGEARKRASGFGGTGFKFDEEEELEVKKTKALWRRELESSAGIDDFVEEEEVGVVEEEEVAAPAPAAPTTMVGGLPMTAGGKLDTAAMVSAARQRAMEIERLLDKASGKTPSFQGEVEINDYPQQARFKVCHREFMGTIHEMFGCSMKVLGVHVEKGRKPNPGDSKLHILVDGPTQLSVEKACREILRYLEELALQFGFNEKERSGKYSVV